MNDLHKTRSVRNREPQNEVCLKWRGISRRATFSTLRPHVGNPSLVRYDRSNFENSVLEPGGEACPFLMYWFFPKFDKLGTTLFDSEARVEHYCTYLYGRKTAKFDDFRIRSALTKDFRHGVLEYYKSCSPTNALSFETDFILGSLFLTDLVLWISFIAVLYSNDYFCILHFCTVSVNIQRNSAWNIINEFLHQMFTRVGYWKLPCVRPLAYTEGL